MIFFQENMSEQILRFSLTDGRLLLHLQPFHKPAEALRIQKPQLCFRPWPLKSPVGQPFVQQDISFPTPVQCLDPAGSAAAEQEQAFLIHFVPELLCNNCCQTIDATAKICVTAGNVIIIATEWSGAMQKLRPYPPRQANAVPLPGTGSAALPL